MQRKVIELDTELTVKLIAIAKRLGKSISQTLSDMIAERYSASDVEKNKARRDANWEKYLASGIEDKSQRQVWRNGYAQGWVDFQQRHWDEGIVIIYQDWYCDEDE